MSNPRIEWRIGPDWTDKDGLASLIVTTASLPAAEREREFQKYVEKAVRDGHDGALIVCKQDYE